LACVFEKEKELTQIRGHYDVLKVTLEKIEPQVKTLKEQISVYQKNSIDSKLALDSEVVRRMELQSTIETKDEEIAFIRRTYEEKIMFLMEFDLDVGSDKIEAEMAIAMSVSAQSSAAAMSVQLSALQAKCSALEADLSSERSAHASALAAKNAEINALKMEFKEACQLMDKTQFFDAKIATYQRLLRIGHRDFNLCKVVTC
jgi:pimeloyl-CoA synthetase